MFKKFFKMTTQQQGQRSWSRVIVEMIIVLIIFELLLAFSLRRAAENMASNPILFIIIYFILTMGLGALAYREKTGLWNPIGMLATTISFAPLMLMELFFGIPKILSIEDSIGARIGVSIVWSLVTSIPMGIGFFIHFINMRSIAPVRHLIIGMVYCGIVVLILANILTPEKVSEIKSIYGLI